MLNNFDAVRSRAFSATWQSIPIAIPSVAANSPFAPFLALLASASGIVLELGPGDGRQISNISDKNIKIVYGAEPCKGLHGPLKKTALREGFDVVEGKNDTAQEGARKYQILACGGERDSLRPMLQEVGLLREKSAEPVFDTIVCSKVLCSVTQLEDTLALLYDLLKPGGRMLVCEHIVNRWPQSPKGGFIGMAIQLCLTTLGWTYVLDGCQLRRETDKVLKMIAQKDGGWAKENLEFVDEWGAVPFVMGELVKRC